MFCRPFSFETLMAHSNLRSLKKFLLRSFFFRKIDFYCRKSLSYFFLMSATIELLINNLSNHQKNISHAYILFIGGIGDFLSMSNVINTLELKGLNIIAYTPEPSAPFAKSLFPNIDVRPYNFSNFLKVSLEIRASRNSCFIFTNPIIESHIFKFLSGIKCFAGYSVDYSRLTSNFFPVKNRYKADGLYSRSSDLAAYLTEIFPERLNKNSNPSPICEASHLLRGNIVIVNFYKSVLWTGPGNIDKNIQVYLLNNLCAYFPNYQVIYVGTSELFGDVQNVISGCNQPNRIQNFCGKTTPEQLIDLVKRSQFAVTIDGGLLHLAYSLHTSTYVLTNFSDSNFFLPTKERSIQSFTNCSPCLQPKGDPVDNYPVICNSGYRCSRDYDKLSLDKFLNNIKSHELSIR